MSDLTNYNGGGRVRKYKTLASWIKDALQDGDKDGPCTAISVVHKKSEGGLREIHTVKLEGKTWEPDQLAGLFQGKAETFAQDLGGIQRFELLAFYKGSREVGAVHPFTIVDGELSAGGAARAVRETNDSPGLLAQLMRHLERKDDILSGIVGMITKNSLEREAKLYEREDKSREETNDAYLLVREMLMEKVKADHEMRMKELEFQRNTQEREKVLKILPALANTVSGREIFPQNAADTALIEMIAEKVNPKQIEMLMQSGLITSEVAGALQLRLAEIHTRKTKEAEAAKQLPEAKNVNGGIS